TVRRALVVARSQRARKVQAVQTRVGPVRERFRRTASPIRALLHGSGFRGPLTARTTAANAAGRRSKVTLTSYSRATSQESSSTVGSGRHNQSSHHLWRSSLIVT